ncbi:MAG: hypothetical protein COB15_15380 [Flavobacteriales bacterium]|nr:MAG: hypothetical protein COB15_15380 [Flavobacteriales bacterium]
MSRNKKIFQVRALHSYFDKNECKCLTFEPSKSTLKLMQRFGLHIHLHNDGFSFFATTKDSINNYLAYIETVSRKSSFEFEIQPKIDNFNVFTDLPVDWSGTISFNTDNESNILSNGTLDIEKNYSFKKSTGSLALLTINFKDILKYGDLDSFTEFQIKFNRRATQWQYYIINRSAVKLDNPKISSKTDINFTGPVKTTIATGIEALLFTSGEQLIPLSKTPLYKFSLINESAVLENTAKSKTSSKIIFNALPNPKTEMIGFKVDTDTKLVSSPMYVYI